MKCLTGFLVVLVVSALPGRAQPVDSSRARVRVHDDCRSCHLGADSKGGRSWWQGRYRTRVTTAGNRSRLDNVSLLCMSCHDGVTAGDITPANHGGRLIIGMGLADDHPVGVVYPPPTRRGNRYSGYHPRPRGSIELYGPRDSRRIQCLSCHTPHPGRHPKLLRESMIGSALCLKCHDL